MSLSTLPRVSPNSKPVQMEEPEVSPQETLKSELSEFLELFTVVVYGIGKYTLSPVNNASSSGV